MDVYDGKDDDSAATSFTRLKLFYELLDIGLMSTFLCNIVTSMLDYDLQDYVMNAFYFITFKFIETSASFNS